MCLWVCLCENMHIHVKRCVHFCCDYIYICEWVCVCVSFNAAPGYGRQLCSDRSASKHSLCSPTNTSITSLLTKWLSCLGVWVKTVMLCVRYMYVCVCVFVCVYLSVCVFTLKSPHWSRLQTDPFPILTGFSEKQN